MYEFKINPGLVHAFDADANFVAFKRLVNRDMVEFHSGHAAEKDASGTQLHANAARPLDDSAAENHRVANIEDTAGHNFEGARCARQTL